MTTPGPSTKIQLHDAVDALVGKLREHEAAADEIRATLRDLKRKIAASGKRAGAKARRGKRRVEVEPPLPGMESLTDAPADAPPSPAPPAH